MRAPIIYPEVKEEMLIVCPYCYKDQVVDSAEFECINPKCHKKVNWQKHGGILGFSKSYWEQVITRKTDKAIALGVMRGE